MPTARMYGPALTSLATKKIDFLADTMKAMLVGASYTPNTDTHQWRSDVTGEVSGTGYTAGGATLSGKTASYVAPNSWTTSRANSTAYSAGDVVRPASANGYLYRAITSGTSGSSVPSFPTAIGADVVDGGVTWSNLGTGMLVLDANDPTWAGVTVSGVRWMVVYDATPATDATRPLLCVYGFDTDQSVTNGTFTAVLGPAGVAVLANS